MPSHKLALLLSSLLFLSSRAVAQTYFSRTYPNTAFAGACLTADGGLVLVYDNGWGGDDRGLMHIDSLGEVEWMSRYQSLGVNEDQVYDGTPYDAIFKDVAAMGDSGYLVVGRAITTLPPYYLGNQFMLGVFDTLGVPQYAGTSGGNFSQEYIFAIAAPGAAAFFGGSYDGLSGTFGNLGLLQYGATSFTATGIAGTPPATFVLDAALCSGGGYIVGGVTVVEGVFVRRLDPALVSTWHRTYAVGDGGAIAAVQVAEAPDGSVFAVSSGPPDIRLFHMDATGNDLGVHGYVLPTGFLAGPTDLLVRPNGKVVIAGVSWIMQVDASGPVDWMRSFPGHNVGGLESVPGMDAYYVLGGSPPDSGWVMRPDPDQGIVPGCIGMTVMATDSVISYPSSLDCCDIASSGFFGHEHHHVSMPVVTSVSAEDCPGVGIAPVASFELRTSPNPTFDHFIIRTPQLLDAHDRIELMGSTGHVLRILHGNNTHELRIDGGDLPAGLYLIRVLRNGAQLGTARVVIE